MKPTPVFFPAVITQRVGPDLVESIVGVGPAALLAEPLLGLVSSRECPGHVLLETLDRVPEWVKAGRVIVSGFHSPLEQQVLRSVLRRKASRVVRVLARNARGDRQKPLLLVAPDWQSERDRLAELMRLRFSQGESVGVLLPQRRLVFGYAKGFKELGIDVLTDTREGIEFGDPRPKVLSYHEAKGLTFDSIFMPRLDTGAFNEHMLRRQLPLMFVGVSRAVRWACFSTLEERMIPPVAAIVNGEVPEYMEVQSVGASSGTTSSNQEDEELPF